MLPTPHRHTEQIKSRLIYLHTSLKHLIKDFAQSGPKQTLHKPKPVGNGCLSDNQNFGQVQTSNSLKPKEYFNIISLWSLSFPLQHSKYESFSNDREVHILTPPSKLCRSHVHKAYPLGLQTQKYYTCKCHTVNDKNASD